MSPKNKAAMLRLRNRIINRFKTSKKIRTVPKTKVIHKKSINILLLKNGKKCLRAFPVSDRITVTSEKMLAQSLSYI